MNNDVPDTDRQLLAQALAGHGNRFGEIFTRHRDRVFRHAYGVLHDASLAEEVTAMVFYEAWRKRESIRLVDDSCLAWLLVTANYTLRNQSRQQRRYKHFLSQLPPPAKIHDFAEELTDDLATSRQAEQIRAAFSRLSAASRDVLTLCIIQELSVAQTARLLKIPEGTVKSRLSRAKTKLAGLLAHTQPTPTPIPSLSERSSR